MANVTGRPVAPARKLVAAVLGTIAGFVMVFGLGMSSWAVVALGAALLALAVALGMVNVARRGARAWIAGQGQVKAVSDPPPTAAYGRAEIQLVVVAPGLPITEVLVRDPRVPVSKWPLAGDTVPLTVDVDDMRRVRIDWDQAPDRGDDGDPPPPTGYDPAYDQPDEYLDDDLLGEPEPPPWATRDRQWGQGPDEPPPPPPPAGADPDVLTSPIVVHDTPRGPVLEGQLVDPGDPARYPGRPDRSEVLSDFPAAAGPSAAGDFAAAPPASAYPSQAEESPYTRTAPEPASIVEPIPIVEPVHEYEAPPTEPDAADPTDSAAAAARPSGSKPSPRRPRPHPADDSPHAASPATGDPEIDLPLDGDPDTPPEFGPEARAAMDSGIIAAPAEPPSTPGDAESRATDARGDDQPPRPTITGVDSPAAESPSDAPTGDPTPDVDRHAPASGSDTDRHDAEPGSRTDSGPLTHTGRGTDADQSAGRAGTTAGTAATAGAGTAATAGAGAAAAAGAGAAAAAGTAAGLVGAHAISRDDAARAPRQADPPAAAPPTEPPQPTATAGARPITPEEAAQRRPDDQAPSPTPEPSSAPDTDAPRTTPTGPGRPWADLETSGYEPDDRADDLITAYPSARPGPAGAIHGVGITVLVSDLSRSRAFYRDTLGFFEIDHGQGSAVLASGDTRLVLRAVEGLSSDASRLVHLNLEVGDVDAVHAELAAKGVPFEHTPRPVDRGDKLELWAATFHDPDGNTIAITQWRAVR